MRLRLALVAALTVLAVAAAAVPADGRPRAAKRLKAFASCEARAGTQPAHRTCG